MVSRYNVTSHRSKNKVDQNVTNNTERESYHWRQNVELGEWLEIRSRSARFHKDKWPLRSPVTN